ncbi:MAG: CRTAC1 family protein [Candidatus Acidiferrales bacterium]
MRSPKSAGVLACTAVLALAATSFPAGQQQKTTGDEMPRVRYVDPDIGADTLELRKKAQLQAAKRYEPFHDFRFTDRVTESGITFVHRIASDAGRTYKAIHYDHGNGIAVADVDGDGLYDIYFVNQLGGNELWKNLGGGKFRNITAEAGVALAERISVAASFADTDNDGDPDLFVTTVRGGNALFENDGRGRFKDITQQAGLGLSAHSSGAVFFDYDRDGLLDLFVCNVGRYTTDQRHPDGSYVGVRDAFHGHLHKDRYEYSVLYKNLGNNRFQDVSEETGLLHAAWTGDASVADVNEDGWPDLYALNMQGDDVFWLNEDGKKFIKQTAAYFPKTPWGSMGIKFFDYDNDGRRDLFITDMHSDMWEHIGPAREKMKARRTPDEKMLQGGANNIFGNALYRNKGKGQFEEVSDRAGAENYWPWGPSIGDVNADDADDIFIASSMNFPFRYGINSLRLNDAGKKFLASEFVLGIEPRRDGRTDTDWFDVDCSNGGMEPNNLLAGTPCDGQTGRIMITAPLGSRAAVIFDLDNDGDLDIVTNDFNSAPQVLVSNLAERKAIRWLKVLLVGTVSNRDGLGATVRVRAGARTYTKYHDGKSGYLSHSALPLYFGLGSAEKIESIEVTWPSGKTQSVKHGQVNQTLQIVESK